MVICKSFSYKNALTCGNIFYDFINIILEVIIYFFHYKQDIFLCYFNYGANYVDYSNIEFVIHAYRLGTRIPQWLIYTYKCLKFETCMAKFSGQHNVQWGEFNSYGRHRMNEKVNLHKLLFCGRPSNWKHIFNWHISETEMGEKTFKARWGRFPTLPNTLSRWIKC